MSPRVQLASELVVHSARLIRLVRASLDQPAGVRVLALLDQHGPMSVTGLALADQCSQPTMTGTVNDLVERGWVLKQPHPRDARSLLISATPDGEAALKEIRQRNADLVITRLGAHTHEELATAVSVLHTITEADR